MKGSSLYMVFYAATLGAVCAGLLTLVGNLTRERREANKEAERVRNVLGVLEIPYEKTLDAKGLLGVYEESVKERALGDLELFSSLDAAGKERLVAVGIDGPGVWGPIKGFMSLDPDMKTIRGITFHEQEETPGLGAEITTVAFRDRFKGKLLVGPGGKPGLRIKAGASGPTGIDAISGATMTCDKVQDLLNATIAKIVAEKAK
jgi:Na+-transporting NADH:ubiquinone oxidoreductase subunit C